MTNTARKYNQEDAWCRGCKGANLAKVGEKDGFALMRCADCKTVVVNPYPADAELMEYYQQYRKTGEYLGKKDSKLRRAQGRVKSILSQKPPGKKFLDVGCSVGFVVVSATDMGCEATGIDIDADVINIANREFAGKGRFEAIAVQDLAARGDKFDMVYSSEVVEHVRDPEDFIAAISKVMNPGAVLYLTAPDGAHFRVPKDFSSWGMVCPPEHLTFFSRKGITQLLARHGLKVEKFQLAFKPGLKVFARKAYT